MHLTNLIDIGVALRSREIDLEIILADAVPEVARQAGAETGLLAVDSVQELIDSDIDGLFIAASTDSHMEIIRVGLAAKVPIFCEKPVASNVPDSIQILRETQEANSVIQVGHHRRFDAGYQEAKRRFDAGELGWLHSLQAVAGDAFPPPVSYCATSGGIFRDMLVHDFDIIRWITGQEIIEVYARGSNNGDPEIKAVGDVDTGIAALTLADGTLATALATRYNGAGYDARLDVMGAKGSAIVGLDEKAAFQSAEKAMTFPSGEPHSTFAERFAPAYKAQCLAFVELIMGERENPCTPFEAISAALVADAAQLSLATGKPVKIPPLQDIIDGRVEPLEVRELQPA